MAMQRDIKEQRPNLLGIGPDSESKRRDHTTGVALQGHIVQYVLQGKSDLKYLWQGLH